jgi:hypothetical protein
VQPGVTRHPTFSVFSDAAVTVSVGKRIAFRRDVLIRNRPGIALIFALLHTVSLSHTFSSGVSCALKVAGQEE